MRNDPLILAALKDGPLPTSGISKLTGKHPNALNAAIRRMAAAGVIHHCGWEDQGSRSGPRTRLWALGPQTEPPPPSPPPLKPVERAARTRRKKAATPWMGESTKHLQGLW